MGRKRCRRLQVWSSLPPATLEHLKAELDFFDKVTNVSGQLYPVPKDERKAGAVRLVRQAGFLTAKP